MKKAKMPEDTTLQHVPQPSEAARLPQLPPLSIDTMTQVELRDFIPQLISIVMAQSGTYDSQPEWWPLDVPWSAGTKTDILYKKNNRTEPLRDVVRRCYKHMGQEGLLRSTRRESRNQRKTVNDGKAYSAMSNTPTHTDMKTHITPEKSAAGGKLCSFAEIYICFFCEQEFTNRDEMRQHQSHCKDRPPELLEARKTPPQTTDPCQGPPQMSPVKQNPYSKSPRPAKENFIQLFNLVPKQKADKILARHRNSLDVECSEIDFSVPDTPISPTTPRTPKSLISQLSRDDNVVSRKRLNYSEAADADDKESVVSGCSEDSEEKPAQKGKSLLTIDISSLLGQRIQKHVKTDCFVHIVDNTESFCKTPVKNQFYEKLRNRTISYPVTYRPRRKNDERSNHEYDFNKNQKKEKLKKLNGGLNKASRRLYREMKKCSVIMARLNRKELKRFLSQHSFRKHLGLKSKEKHVESVFPKEPVLLSQDVDRLLGLKKRSDMKLRRGALSLANVVSEDTNAEITKQKLTIYRCLLSDLARLQSSVKKCKGTQEIQQSLKKEIKSDPPSPKKEIKRNPPSPKKQIKSDAQSPKPAPLDKIPKMPLSPPESLLEYKVKKKSPALRTDDDVSIISVDSDDESVNSRCCVACRRKKLCPYSPEISLNRMPTPLNIPLSVSTTSSSQVSPCSCMSSPGSDVSLVLRLSPDTSKSNNVSPQSTDQSKEKVKETSQLEKPTTRSKKENAIKLPSIKSLLETPIQSSSWIRTGQENERVSRTSPRKTQPPLTLRTSPRKSLQLAASSKENIDLMRSENLKSSMKRVGSAPQLENKTVKLVCEPKKSASEIFNADGTYELIIKTRSKSGVPLKRSQRLSSSFEYEQSSPKKFKRMDTKFAGQSKF